MRLYCRIFFHLSAAPDPPENVILVSNSSRSVNISWSDGFNGNSVILDYKVTITSKGQALENVTCDGIVSADGCNVTSKTVHIGGLQPFTEYQIKVVARNNVGLSEGSPLLNVTTDEEGKLHCLIKRTGLILYCKLCFRPEQVCPTVTNLLCCFWNVFSCVFMTHTACTV